MFWAQEFAVAMRQRNLRIKEELVLDALLQDLKGLTGDRAGPSSSQEDGVEVPIKELPARSVSASRGKVDYLASFGIELFAVAEVRLQPGADNQPVAGIDAEVSAIKQRVDI